MNHPHCFLCRFNTHRDSIEMHQFMQEHVGSMHIDALSLEVHLELVNRREPMSDACCDDISFEVVREHILSHTLNPVVRVGMMLRELLELKDRMRGELHKIDANGQHLGMDPKMVESYLRVHMQVLNVFKSEPSKMQFNLPGGVQPQ